LICCADILLCHDDELDTRRVAFALYLTPSWSKEDGGLLDLFDMDGRYDRFCATKIWFLMVTRSNDVW